MYTSFFPDFLDPSQLSMPLFCAKNVVSSIAKHTWKDKPAIKPLKYGREGMAEIEANEIPPFFEKRLLQNEE